MSLKAKHKELKKQVLIAEENRNMRRGKNSWYDLRTLKKEKLKAKDRLNEIKKKFFIKRTDHKSDGRA